jgi:guanylate kinase
MDNMQPSSTTPHLTRRQEFERALANYSISERAKRVLAELKLVLLSGASASGRNTVISHLVQTGAYRFIVSDTTRPPRVNDGIPEQDGREYWFRGEDEMLQELRQGEFLEAEIIHQQQVSGISIRELERTIAEHKIAINEVEIGGFKNVAKIKPDTVAIILLPPSYEEWQRRLMGRGQMAPSELKNRMETAVRVFTEATEGGFAALVVNSTVEQAAQQIDRIVQTGEVDQEEQRRAQALAKGLLEKTQNLLETL